VHFVSVLPFATYVYNFYLNKALLIFSNYIGYSCYATRVQSKLLYLADVLSYAHDTLAGNSRWNPAPESGAGFQRELQQNLR